MFSTVAGGEDDQLPLTPDGTSSELTFNWWGLVAFVIIGALAVIAWRSTADSGDVVSSQLGVVATTAPSEPAETTRPTTGPPRPTAQPTPSATEPSTATTVASDAQVQISGEMKPCRFGDNCLVASFTIAGFDEHPGKFICIYPESQSEFTFNNDGVGEACLTADDGDTITIEVDGVRSATISERSLDGT